MGRAAGRAVILLAAAGIVLAGCGLKTPVVPPEAAAPERIRDLAAVQDETGIVLEWSAPRRSRNGKRLAPGDLAYRVLRAESGVAGFCPGCPLAMREAARLEGKTRWRDPGLVPGRVYSYQVVAQNGPFSRSMPSNRADAAWDELPPAPPAPQAEPGDHQVTIRARSREYGFELEKRGRHGFTVIARRPAPGPFTYHDRTVGNGETAAYRMRFLKPAGGTGLFIRGPASDVVTARPRDLTPPPAVTRLTLVETGKGIALFWPPVSAADLAGYRVERRARGRTEDIGGAGPEKSSFIDRFPPQAAGEWAYRVLAVDRAGNAAAGAWVTFNHNPPPESRTPR